MVFPGLPIPVTYAKVESGEITRLVAVESYQYIIDNPERYGDSSLYFLVDYNEPSSQCAVVGMKYDYEKQIFFDPFLKEAE